MRHKRVELLVRSIPQLREDFPDLTVNVVGDGPERGRLELLTQQLGLEAVVGFLGHVDDATRDSVVASAWLAVSPSAGEGWGLSVMEAAALGVPTVAMSVPGLRDSIRHRQTGWLCDAEESLALVVARALAAVRDQEDAERWSLRCQEWAVGFSWERAAALIHSVMSSERERVSNRYDDRRRRNDASTVIRLAPQSASVEVLSGLRRTDQLRIQVGTLELLLPNADEVDARAALKRVGLRPDAITDIRIARPVDLLGWEVVGRARLALEGMAPVGELTPTSTEAVSVLPLNAGAALGK